MPRHARLDIPGVLQHVIVRGIEKRRIFLDNKDRLLFVDRLSSLLLETDTDCFAWALLPNHIHLLLRPNHDKLSTFMRRLLTGHAVTFNLRHKRSGHLFQNRYKSIICEEEPYLLELVRYIHLNPLRAGLVTTIDQLDRYQWSGHAILMGKRAFPGQNTSEVLLRFSATLSTARSNYKAFVAGGISMGKRDDLIGGGLRRSLQSKNVWEITASDERILGTGVFVENIKKHERICGPLTAIPLDAIIQAAASFYRTDSKHLAEKTRKRVVADARCLISYVAVRRMGYNGQEVAERLNVTRLGVSKAAQRAQSLLECESSLRDFINKLTS
jgi:REP element-mobilizing transposase RayT